MINLTAKIDIISGDNNTLSLGSSNLLGNNISSDLSGVVGVKGNGSNPFIFGVSKFGDGSVFSGEVDYFISDKLSEDNGLFQNNFAHKVAVSYFATPDKVSFSGDSTSVTIYKDMVFAAIDSYTVRFVPEKVNVYAWLDDYTLISSIDGNNNYKSKVTIENAYYNKQSGALSFTIKVDTSNFPFVLAGTYVELEIKGSLVAEYNNYRGYRFELNSTKNVETFSIAFDTANNRHPNTIKVDGVEYADDDAIFTVSNLQPSTTHTIEIDNWNTPNAPLVITGIYNEISIDIDRRNLIAISRSIFDRSDLKLPSFGIISNKGEIEFNDTNGEILDYANQLLLESGAACTIKLNNTLVKGASQTIAVMETDEWNYDSDSKVVSVSLKDDLQEWQEINVEAINYDPRNLKHEPFSWLYKKLWEITKVNYDMLSLSKLDQETQDILNHTFMVYPLLESGTLWESWQKLCEVCQLHIYKDNNGRIVCKYNGGN